MKVLTKNNVALYSLTDDTYVDLASDKVTVGDPVRFYIEDCNSTNTTLHIGVTDVPADWTGFKYLYDGVTWTQNPDWVEPDE